VPGCYSIRVFRLCQESNLFLSIAERPCDVTMHHSDIAPEHAAIVVGVPKQLRRGEKFAYRTAGNGKSGMIIGEAKDDKELFEFTIESLVTTGSCFPSDIVETFTITSPGNGDVRTASFPKIADGPSHALN
jgi:hypothetical protein